MATTWTATAELDAEGNLAMTGGPGSPWDGSPVDWLTAAVAGCFVKSCHMVLKARREEPVAVRAVVSATKADDLPARVGRIEIAWSMPGLSAEHGARIARDAKRICTVTNSMTSEFEVVPA